MLFTLGVFCSNLNLLSIKLFFAAPNVLTLLVICLSLLVINLQIFLLGLNNYDCKFAFRDHITNMSKRAHISNMITLLYTMLCIGVHNI